MTNAARLGACALATLLAAGCPDDDPGMEAADSGDPGADSGTGDDDDDDDDDDSSDTGGEGLEHCDEVEPGGLVPEETSIPADCEDPVIDKCKLDQDHDGVPLFCDNAPDTPNAAQHDIDGDLIGDAVDLCPVAPDEAGNNTHDSDKDGIGNACDRCPMSPRDYNEVLEAAGVPVQMQVRGNPYQGDADQDGVGDACDNCPTVPNCGGFGPDNPPDLDSDLPLDDLAQCQTDTDADGIGDACEGRGAGFGDEDDFDLDGLPNAVDGCPRIPAEGIPCESDADCGEGSSCAADVCNHADRDADGVGDVCDSCRESPNPEQLTGADDADGDFVGDACETDPMCFERSNPRRIGFFDVAVDGYCCVRAYPGDDVWSDPLGVPVREACTELEQEEGVCVLPPDDILAAPGWFQLPAGCREALDAECKLEASAVTMDDVDGDLDDLWGYACRLPQADTDLDGVGDLCDLCWYAHDPSNEPYVDSNGMQWPNDGAACNGELSLDNADPANDCWF